MRDMAGLIPRALGNGHHQGSRSKVQGPRSEDWSNAIDQKPHGTTRPILALIIGISFGLGPWSLELRLRSFLLLLLRLAALDLLSLLQIPADGLVSARDHFLSFLQTFDDLGVILVADA